MDRALTDHIEQQVRQAFPEGVIARVQVLQYGDDPEVEPRQAAMRVFFDWPGRAGGGQADPQTLHRFVTANAAVLGVLRDGLPRVIGWVEFRPEGAAGAASPHGMSYRITDRGRPAPARDEPPEDRTPVRTFATVNGTCGPSSASTPDITTGTARTSPASNDRPTRTTKPARRWTCRFSGARCSVA
jgi:hypothetical protein